MVPTYSTRPVRVRLLARLLSMGAALAALAACDASENRFLEPSPPPLEIVGPDRVEGADETVVYQVTGAGSDRDRVQWSSSDPAVLEAAVPAGTFVSRGAGTATIRVTLDERSAEKEVTVEVDDAAVLVILATGDTLLTEPDDTLVLVAALRYASGAETAVDDTEWSSSRPEVATVAGGRVVARADGRTVITARAAGEEARLPVRVEMEPAGSPSEPPPSEPPPSEPPPSEPPPSEPPPSEPPTLVLTPAADTVLTSVGDTLVVTAELRYPSGARVTPDGVEWSSSDAGVVTVADGRVVARSNGRAVIRARVGGVEASLPVRVSQLATALTLSADEYRIDRLGGTVQLEATLRDRRGHPVPGVPFTWSSSDPQRISVDAGGLATAVGYGSATITVRAGLFSRTARVQGVTGTAPTVVDLRAGITRSSPDEVASYVVLHAEVRDAERDLDSMTVALQDAGGRTLVHYREPIARGVESVPLSLHASSAAGATRARIEVFDAAGNRTTEVVELKRSPNDRAPRIDDLVLERVGTDSVQLEIEGADAELDVDVLWLVGFGSDGGWTLIEGFSLTGVDIPEWYTDDVGLRDAAVAQTRTFGVMLMDRESNLSLLHLVPADAPAVGAGGVTTSSVRPQRTIRPAAPTVGTVRTRERPRGVQTGPRAR